MNSMSCWKCTVGTGILVTIFTIFVLPWIIYNQVVKPRNPSFAIDHASLTGFNLTSDGHLTSFFNIGLRANNRNQKLKLKYGEIRVSVFKDKQNLGTDSFPGFTQRKRNVTVLNVQPVSLNVKLKKGPASDFRAESGMGYVSFDVFMTAFLNSKNLEVNCKGVMVDVMTANSTSNVTRNSTIVGCSVRVYSDNCRVHTLNNALKCKLSN